MADINQWRRKINPRSKTPTADQEERAHGVQTRTRPKLSSFLSYGGKDQATKDQPNVKYEPQWPTDQGTSDQPAPRGYDPDVDRMAQGIISTILDDPHAGLTPNFNSSVMHIISAYNKLMKEKQELEDVKAALEERLWDAEGKVAEYKMAEQAAMQTPIARRHSSRPRAKTTSEMDKNQSQTVFEFLRGPESPSPRGSGGSADLPSIESTLSQWHTQDQPHQLARPTGLSQPKTLQAGRVVESAAGQAEITDDQESMESLVELSSNGYSSWSSNGDLLPDEIEDKDWGDLRRFAERMSAQRGIPVERTFSHLVSVFFQDNDTILNLDGTNPSRPNYAGLRADIETGSPPIRHLRSSRDRQMLRTPAGHRPTTDQSQQSNSSHVSQTDHRTSSRFSFSSGEDKISRKDKSSLTLSDDLMVVSDTCADQHDSGRGSELLKAQDKNTVPGQTPSLPETTPVTARKLRYGGTASQLSIAPPRRSQIPQPRNLRDRSSSDVLTTMNHSPTTDTSSRQSSVTYSERQNSGQPSTAGLQSQDRLSSDIGTSGVRRPLAKQASTEAFGDSSSLRRSSNVATAIAAARVAEERGKQHNT